MCAICDRAAARFASLASASSGFETGSGSGASANAPGASARPSPPGAGGPGGRRLVIRGGTVLSMDPAVGDFAQADVLVEGGKIVAIGPTLDAGDAEVVDAAGMIVCPGFVDTHHHQFETALRSFLADGILINDGKPHGAVNYYEYVLQNFAKVYEPEDIYISELFGSLSQLDAGVTTVMDVSQIHHSPEHSDAVIQALKDAGRRAVLGYFEGAADRNSYPGDARRLKSQYFASDDQLISMVMGGEIYLPGYEQAWRIGRELALPIALHVVGTFGMAPTFDELARSGQFGPDNIFIHMTGMTDLGWRAAADAGAHISLSVPIEMTMRHGQPPIQRALQHGLQPSLSTDVECTMTADPFTQMRSALTLQRMFVNEAALAGEQDLPPLLTSRDVLRFATVEGAKGLKLDRKTGSLTPGKEADLLLLDATAINVAPLNNAAGAVVTLMERSNVDSVMVAGKFRKRGGALLDVQLGKLRGELEASRDRLFERAGVKRELFGA